MSNESWPSWWDRQPPLDPLPDWPLDELPAHWQPVVDLDNPFDLPDVDNPPNSEGSVNSGDDPRPPDLPPRLILPADYDDELDAAVARVLAWNRRHGIGPDPDPVPAPFDDGDPPPLDDADYWEWLWRIFVPDDATLLPPSFSAGSSRLPSDRPSTHTGFTSNAYSDGVLLFRSLRHGVHIQTRLDRHAPWLREQVRLWLANGVVSRARAKWCLPIFAVPKGPTKLRCVYDATLYNDSISAPPKIRLPRPQNVIDVAHARSHRFACKLDLADAFLTIRLKDSELGFCVEGTDYTFQRMPFGIRQAPFILHSLLRPIKKAAPRGNAALFVFYDDFLVTGETKRAVHDTVSNLLRLLSSHGFKVNAAKSQFKPTQRITFLGCEVDLHNHSISQSASRISSALRVLEMLKTTAIPIKMAQRVAGTFAWLAQTIRPLRAILRPICSAIGRSRATRVRLRFPWKLTRAMLLANPRIWPHTRTSSTYYCDATPYQMAIVRDRKAQAFSFGVRCPIFTAESCAIFWCVVDSPTPHTLIYADNQAANGAMSKLRSSSPDVNILALWLASYCSHTRKSFTVKYVRSENNPADAPSRSKAHLHPPHGTAGKFYSVWQHAAAQPSLSSGPPFRFAPV